MLIIPLWNNFYSIKINTNDSYYTSLRTETSRIRTKIIGRYSIKYKELSPSSIGVESSRVTTEFDYITKVYPRPTPEELNTTGNAEKNVSGIMVGKTIESWKWKNGKTNYSSKKRVTYY